MRTIKEALEEGSLSLEDEIDYADMTEEEYKKEIERLNNIINELEKYIKNNKVAIGIKKNSNYAIPVEYVLDKLQELKGSESNE